MEVLARRGSSFDIGVRSQARGPTWGSLLFLAPFFPTLACLPTFWASSSWGRRVCLAPTTSFPFGSRFLFRSAGWKGRAGGGVGNLVWATFPRASLPGWDSIKSIRLEFDLHWIPISLSIGENGGPRSGIEISKDKAWLKTSNSSSESDTSTTSSSSVLVGRDEVATLLSVVMARLLLVCLQIWALWWACLLEQGRKEESLELLRWCGLAEDRSP